MHQSPRRFFPPLLFLLFSFFHNFNEEEDPGYKAVFIPSIGNDVEQVWCKSQISKINVIFTLHDFQTKM